MTPDLPLTQAPTSRRDFMKLSLFGSLALGAGAGLSGCAGQPARYYDQTQHKEYFFLTSADVGMLHAIAPAILAGALPPDDKAANQEVTTVVDYIDRGVDSFGTGNQQEIRKLFDLLTFAPTRALAAGVWTSWDKVTPQRADEFLNDWRNSSIGLFNNAYGALIKLTALVDYGLPANWERSGYPGPPAYARETLPQFRTEAAA